MNKIETVFHDFCEDCPYVDAKTSTLYSDNEVLFVNVSCKNYNLCESLYKRLKQMNEHEVKE